MKAGCAEYDVNYNPKFIFVIGTKRHFKKFFALRNGRFENLAPGSVICDKFVRADCPEFFMMSHYPLKVLVFVIFYTNNTFRALENLLNIIFPWTRLEFLKKSCKRFLVLYAILIKLLTRPFLCQNQSTKLMNWQNAEEIIT